MENPQASSKSKTEQLLEFYASVLESVYIQTDDDGLLSLELGDGESRPSFIGERRMVLPTRDMLKTQRWDDRVAFHPLSENTGRSDSEVLKKLKDLVNFRLTLTLSTLLTELVEIAADKDYHDKLTPQQSEFLKVIPKASKKTVDDVTEILDRCQTKGERQLAAIYLKRGGNFKGDKFSRVAVTSFPITEEFDNDDRSIFGVKLRVADFKALPAVFEYIVPNCQDLEAYSFGSNDMTAPGFHSLMKSFAKIAKKLNKTTHLFRKHLDNPDALKIDVSWEETLSDLTKFRDVIPSLRGNEGKVVDGEEEKPTGPTEEDVHQHRVPEKTQRRFQKMAEEVTTRDYEQPAPPAPPQQEETPPWNQPPATPQWGNQPAPQPFQRPAPAAPSNNDDDFWERNYPQNQGMGGSNIPLNPRFQQQQPPQPSWAQQQHPPMGGQGPAAMGWGQSQGPMGNQPPPNPRHAQGWNQGPGQGRGPVYRGGI